MRSTFLLTVFALLTLGANADPQLYNTITFPSLDGLTITADEYNTGKPKPWMLLCHQAGFSRGEYRETASRFMGLDFNVMAIDQRSGKEANGVTNETANAAKNKGLGTSYTDAEQDILAAIDYLYNKSGQPIILVGSSYSAALALKLGSNTKVAKVVAFSPGEYLNGINVAAEAQKINKPVFVTSSKSEIGQTTDVSAKIDKSKLTHFKPSGDGIHGSRALWRNNSNSEAYWQALIAFLKK